MMADEPTKKRLSKKRAAYYITTVSAFAVAAVWAVLALQINADVKLMSSANTKANVSKRNVLVRRIIKEVIIKKRPREGGSASSTATPSTSSTAVKSTTPPPAASAPPPQQPQVPRPPQPVPQPTTRAS